MEKTELIVASAFREITEKGIFDIEKGNAPMPKVENMKMSDIPKELTNYVNECGYGCCFVFAAYMINVLKKYDDIKPYLIVTDEGKGLRASVLYKDNEKWFVANPVEDIEYFTDNNIPFEERKNYYIDNTATMVVDEKMHNASRYTLEDFAEKYGIVRIVGSMDNNSKTLKEEMSNIENKCIAPPKQKNYDIKSL